MSDMVAPEKRPVKFSTLGQTAEGSAPLLISAATMWKYLPSGSALGQEGIALKRTDADGHDSNRYTEGNPSLGVPATVVGAEEMNNIQEEIATTVEGAGLTVDQTGSSEGQLLQAI